MNGADAGPLMPSEGALTGVGCSECYTLRCSRVGSETGSEAPINRSRRLFGPAHCSLLAFPKMGNVRKHVLDDHRCKQNTHAHYCFARVLYPLLQMLPCFDRGCGLFDANCFAPVLRFVEMMGDLYFFGET